MELKHDPVSVHFNVAVMTMANLYLPFGWNVQEDEYKNVYYLRESIRKFRTVLVPRNLLEDPSVFDCKEHETAFWAWYLKSYAEANSVNNWFEQQECVKRAFNTMMLQMFTQYGYSEQSRYWVGIMDIMLNGFFEHRKRHGVFPISRREFVIDALKNGIDEALVKEE